MPIWKKGLRIVKRANEITANYPSEEKFGIISDIRRSSNSTPHNIAEGFDRLGQKIKPDFTKVQEEVPSNL
jgi:four helix bundle protein